MEDRISKLERWLKTLKEMLNHHPETTSLGTVVRSIESKLKYLNKDKK